MLPRSAEIQPHVARIRPSPRNQPQLPPPGLRFELPVTRHAPPRRRLRPLPRDLSLRSKYGYRSPKAREELRNAAEAKHECPEK